MGNRMSVFMGIEGIPDGGSHNWRHASTTLILASKLRKCMEGFPSAKCSA